MSFLAAHNAECKVLGESYAIKSGCRLTTTSHTRIKGPQQNIEFNE